MNHQQTVAIIVAVFTIWEISAYVAWFLGVIYDEVAGAVAQAGIVLTTAALVLVGCHYLYCGVYS